MAKAPEPSPEHNAKLRQRAEAILTGKTGPSPGLQKDPATADIQATLHELRVYQIELELQNDELRRTQVHLQIAQAHYFDLFDMAPVGYAIVSVSGVFVDVNLTAATLLGVTRTALVHRPIFTCIHPGDQSLYARHRQRLIDTGGTQTFELRMIRPDETTFWAHLVATVARDDAGGLVHRIVISDVTLVRASALRQEALFQGARDAIVVTNPKTGSITDVNRQAEALLGRTRDQLIGMHRSQLQPAQRSDAPSGASARSTSAQGSTVETAVLHRDGRQIRVEISSGVIDLADGGHLVMEVVRDIRERLRLQEQLHQGEKINAIGQLAGGVAHDFNNQLVGISGYAELLVSALVDPLHRRWAKAIFTAAQHSADMTQKLLAFARQGQSQRSPTDLRRTITEMIELLRLGLDQRIVVVQRHTDALCLTLGDAGQLHNALLNLALNARDAMPTGGELTFATRHVVLEADSGGFGNAAGRFVEIAVNDTGCGMDVEVRRHLFEPFFSTKEASKGTGLGLASVYGVIKNHGGMISVFSSPGRGSTFCIYLPLFEEPVAAVSDSVATPAEPDSAALHIVIIDDEQLVRDFTSVMLASLGHIPRTCANMDEALALCQSDEPIDVVLLDLTMPRTVCRDAFLALRALRPALRVLLFSGHSLNCEVQAILDLGACGFLQKPFRRADLVQAIRDSLSVKATLEG